MRIVAISGSLRKGSYNTALLHAAQKLAPEMGIEILEYSTVPVFNQDVEETAYPQVMRDLRAKIAAADGVLIAVPEFNRTPAGSLKNFLDWTSRPEEEPNPWNQKPVGILGASSGMRGAVLAQFDIRRIMSYWNARTMGQPEFYLANDEDGKFDADLNLVDTKTTEVLKKFLAAFETFAKK
jgi:chromate reductase